MNHYFHLFLPRCDFAQDLQKEFGVPAEQEPGIHSSIWLLSHPVHAWKNKVSGRKVTSHFLFLVENDIPLPRDPCSHLEFVFEFNRILPSSINAPTLLMGPERNLRTEHWWILQGLVSLSQSRTNWTNTWGSWEHKLGPNLGQVHFWFEQPGIWHYGLNLLWN